MGVCVCIAYLRRYGCHTSKLQVSAANVCLTEKKVQFTIIKSGHNDMPNWNEIPLDSL